VLRSEKALTDIRQLDTAINVSLAYTRGRPEFLSHQG